MRIVSMSCTTSRQAGVMPDARQIPRAAHGPGIRRRSGLAPALIEHGRRVENHAQGNEPTARIPGGGGNSPAGTRDTAHFAHGKIDLRNKLQRKHRDGMVEGGVCKRQRASIADLEVQARVAIAAVGMLDVRRGNIQAVHADDLRVLCQAETQIAGAAPDIEHPYRPGDPGKTDEQGRKAPAPAPHLQLVAVAIGRLTKSMTRSSSDASFAADRKLHSRPAALRQPGRLSVRLDAGRLDQRRVGGDLLFDIGIELGWSHHHRVDTQCGQLVPHLGRLAAP